MSNKYSKNVQTVLDILKDEIDGNVDAALEKMTKDYSMTWMYKKSNGELFPRTITDIDAELRDVYHIKGREYDIKNIAEGDRLIMIEMVESYPDPESNKIYRTPVVLVLEIENGKIKTGRHYCDPGISFINLTEEQISNAFVNHSSKEIIK